MPIIQHFLVSVHTATDSAEKDDLFKLLLTGVFFQMTSYAFNLSMATLIFICTLNPRMLIAKWLGAKVWRPFSRTVFAVYLIHQVLIWFIVQQTREPITITFPLLVSTDSSLPKLTYPLVSLHSSYFV